MKVGLTTISPGTDREGRYQCLDRTEAPAPGRSRR
jgi:hypothetical protein